MNDLTATRLTQAIGAEITGVDLEHPPAEETCDALYRFLMEHQVIFLRDQQMSPATHMALAQSFGEPEPPHPIYPHLEGYPSIMILDFGGNNVPDTDVWHTDVTYRGSPPFASILHGCTIPPVGGDTLWLSMTAAYDRLPSGLKSDIADLRCVHDLGDFRNTFTVGEADGVATRLNDAQTRMGSAIHPLVRSHPATGKPYLFCNPALHRTCRRVDGIRIAKPARLPVRSHHSPGKPGPFSMDAQCSGNLGQQMHDALRARRLRTRTTDHAPGDGHQ